MSVRFSSPRAGYTLVELLVATALTLLIMAGVVSLFGSVMDAISRGQAMMETAERLRSTANRLQLDLKHATARMLPPLDPRQDLGYFEVVEGPGPNAISGAGTHLSSMPAASKSRQDSPAHRTWKEASGDRSDACEQPTCYLVC